MKGTIFRQVQVLIVVVLITVFISSYVYLRQTGTRQQAFQSDYLHSLKSLDVQLDREVLRVISFQSLQYDQLANIARDMGGFRSTIDSPDGASLGHQGQALQDYWQVLDQKLRLVERIKYQAALVRNGLNYMPTAVSSLHTVDEPVHEPALEVLLQLILYNLFPSDSDLEYLRGGIESLRKFTSQDSNQAKLLDNLLFHITANLRELEKLNGLKQEYTALPSTSRYETVYREYEQRWSDTLSRKEGLSKLLILAVSVLLVAFLYLLHRLMKASRLAELSWNRLRDAVDSLTEAFALFDKNGKLVLYNQRYLDYYPWLERILQQNATLNDIEILNAERLVRTTPSGIELSRDAFLDYDKPPYIERIGQQSWYLANDNRTGDGGLVCVRVDVTESKIKELELQKLGRALEQSPASVVITDTRGCIEYVNPKFEQNSGYSSAEVIGKKPSILKGGDKSDAEYKELWETISSGREWRGVFHNRRKDGSIYWESASISPVRNDNMEITHYIGVKEDITAQKRAEEQLRMNATVFETTAEGIMVTDARGRIKTVNPAFSRITGYSADEILGKTSSTLSSGRHREDFYQQMWNTIRERGRWSGEIWNRRKDGSVYPEWLSIATIENNESGEVEYVGVFSDITQRKQDEEQILYQANYDALTALPNRTLLLDRLLQMLLAARRENWSFAVMFVDLDHFKTVNDSFGHVLGDELLQMVAEKLRRSVREVDTVSRFGGDEFVVLLQDIGGVDDAALVANKVVKTLSKPFDLSERSISLGASVGITLFPNDVDEADSLMDTVNTLLSNADMAMYQAKALGRNRYQYFTSAMQDEVKAHLELEQDLRRALKEDELRLHYQPVVDVEAGRISGVEVLLRWQHPERGLVFPGDFIALAEETGLIGPIGEWVFRTACRQVRDWQLDTAYDLRLAVNLSARQRGLGFSAEILADILQETGLPAEQLTIEITENLLLEGSEETVNWLNAFKEYGVSLAIDDFGTGFSSLSYLKRFPVDILKIDQAFVRGLPDDKEDVSLVEAIVAMTRSLGLDIVAEGVEIAAQRDFLRDIGCTHMQGYYFGKPMPPEELLEVLAEKQEQLINSARVSN